MLGLGACLGEGDLLLRLCNVKSCGTQVSCTSRMVGTHTRHVLRPQRR